MYRGPGVAWHGMVVGRQGMCFVRRTVMALTMLSVTGVFLFNDVILGTLGKQAQAGMANVWLAH